MLATSWNIRKAIQYQMQLSGKIFSSVTDIGIEIVGKSTHFTTFRGMRATPGSAGTTTIQLEIDGAAITGATLSWASTDPAYELKEVSISQTIEAGQRISFRTTSAETNARDIYTEID